MCVLTGRSAGGVVIFLLGSRDVACQRFGRPGEGRPLLRAAVCSLLKSHTHTHIDTPKLQARLPQMPRAWPPVTAPQPTPFSFHFTFSANLVDRGNEWEHAE